MPSEIQETWYTHHILIYMQKNDIFKVTNFKSSAPKSLMYLIQNTCKPGSYISLMNVIDFM